MENISKSWVKSVLLSRQAWTRSAAANAKAKDHNRVIVVGSAAALPQFLKKHAGSNASWWGREIKKKLKPVVDLGGPTGPIWLVRPYLLDMSAGEGHRGQLDLSPMAQCRDTLGPAIGAVLEAGGPSCRVEFFGCSDMQIDGAIRALNLASYQYKRVASQSYPPQMKVELRRDGKSIDHKKIKDAEDAACAVNLARHLTNLPPNELNPTTYAEIIETLFKSKSTVKVEVWNAAKLKRENMGLILAVGSASATPPCLVHIRYRPKNSKGTPIAFVGKGVTFDSGGLNIKPDSNMRSMKKDMGGSAAVTAVAWWVAESNLQIPCDFYLALAENAIGGSAFRPGDVLTSRSGKTVEIHNTDAEGRLVLADALDVAIEKNPRMVIDVATLTGAIKAGLGSSIAGLFGNNDKLLELIESGGNETGDWLWQMPLFRKQKIALRSNVADLVNAADGFGGAITAALFLESFVGDISWAHLDVYAWKDAPEGAYTEPGGSGQPVQALIQFLTHIQTSGEENV